MTQDSDPLAQKDKHGKQLGNTKDQYLNIENLIEGRFFQMFLRILQKNRFLWFNCGLTAVYCFSSCTRNVIKITSCLSESLRISAERMLHVLLRFALVGLRQRFRNVSLATCWNLETCWQKPLFQHMFQQIETTRFFLRSCCDILHCLHCCLHCQMSRLHEELLNFNWT